jgi:hypothetical protein
VRNCGGYLYGHHECGDDKTQSLIIAANGFCSGEMRKIQARLAPPGGSRTTRPLNPLS